MKHLRIPIVDRNDNVITYKPRNEVLSGDIYRVTSMWVFNEDGEVLLQKRSMQKAHDPGKWGGSVAGTVEEGETYDSNIRKEMVEELGLSVEPIQGRKGMIDAEHKFFCQFFHTVVPKDYPFVLQEEEVDEVRWFGREELERLMKEDPGSFIKSIHQYLEAAWDLL